MLPAVLAAISHATLFDLPPPSGALQRSTVAIMFPCGDDDIASEQFCIFFISWPLVNRPRRSRDICIDHTGFCCWMRDRRWHGIETVIAWQRQPCMSTKGDDDRLIFCG
jgi:hypothetical protein